jgi:hypothetical protein
MPARFRLRPNIKKLIAYPLAVAVWAIFSASSALAQTTWTINIDATGNQQKPHRYTVNRQDTGTPCKYNNANSDAPKLHVCGNDTIQWVASTDPDSSGNKKNELFIFHEDKVLIDGKNNSVQLLHSSSSDANPAEGIVDPSVVQPGQDISHEYYVIVYDKSNKKWYVEDPTIIIGGTRATDLVLDLQKDCKQLSRLLEKADDLSKTQKDKVNMGCEAFGNIHIPKN